MSYRVSVQVEDFSVDQEYQRLSDGTAAGAVVTFIGKVRDMNLGDNVVGLHLEHYPGMTEKSLSDICDQAESRWPLIGVRVIHRVGDLDIGDQIVFAVFLLFIFVSCINFSLLLQFLFILSLFLFFFSPPFLFNSLFPP